MLAAIGGEERARDHNTTMTEPDPNPKTLQQTSHLVVLLSTHYVGAQWERGVGGGGGFIIGVFQLTFQSARSRTSDSQTDSQNRV
jgi:hypothetical protein